MGAVFAPGLTNGRSVRINISGSLKLHSTQLVSMDNIHSGTFTGKFYFNIWFIYVFNIVLVNLN